MSETLLMKGNEALAEGAIRAGCRHYFGYPITPQTEIAAYMAKKMPKIGGTFLQAESEIAAVNMVYGAASAGVRAMSCSSSPGISLKSEGLSFLIACDLPCLVVNIQRGGPGLGSIQPSQADYNQATKAPGHGDGHLLVFSPATVQEMYDIVFDAFELSEQYRIPAMILGDGLLGQMMEPVEFKERTPRTFDKPWATNGHENKRSHNYINSLLLNSQLLEESILARYQRYAQAEEQETRAEFYHTDDAEIVIAAFGATARIAKGVVDSLRAEGHQVGLIRPITLWPFPNKEIQKATQHAKAVLTVEMNMGQMVADVRLALKDRLPVHFFGHTGGVIPGTEEIEAEVHQLLERSHAK